MIKSAIKATTFRQGILITWIFSPLLVLSSSTLDLDEMDPMWTWPLLTWNRYSWPSLWYEHAVFAVCCVICFHGTQPESCTSAVQTRLPVPARERLPLMKFSLSRWSWVEFHNSPVCCISLVLISLYQDPLRADFDVLIAEGNCFCSEGECFWEEMALN